MSERAIVSRRFMPPEKLSALSFARSASWVNSSSSVARRRISARGRSKYRPYMTRLSIAVSSSSSESSWGTRPRRARIWGPLRFGSMPSTVSSPSVAGEMHDTIFIVEVLPAPFGPRKPKLSPARISKSMPSTAVNAPKRLTSPRAATSGVPITGVPTSATLSGPV